MKIPAGSVPVLECCYLASILLDSLPWTPPANFLLWKSESRGMLASTSCLCGVLDAKWNLVVCRDEVQFGENGGILPR